MWPPVVYQLLSDSVKRHGALRSPRIISREALTAASAGKSSSKGTEGSRELETLCSVAALPVSPWAGSFKSRADLAGAGAVLPTAKGMLLVLGDLASTEQPSRDHSGTT